MPGLISKFRFNFQTTKLQGTFKLKTHGKQLRGVEALKGRFFKLFLLNAAQCHPLDRLLQIVYQQIHRESMFQFLVTFVSFVNLITYLIISRQLKHSVDSNPSSQKEGEKFLV